MMFGGFNNSDARHYNMTDNEQQVVPLTINHGFGFTTHIVLGLARVHPASMVGVKWLEDPDPDNLIASKPND